MGATGVVRIEVVESEEDAQFPKVAFTHEGDMVEVFPAVRDKDMVEKGWTVEEVQRLIGERTGRQDWEWEAEQDMALRMSRLWGRYKGW